MRDNYRRIGGGSPQLRITREQAAGARTAAERRRRRAQPLPRVHRDALFAAIVEDALEAIAAAGIRRIVTLTLFPHWSKATTGSSRNEFDRVLATPRVARVSFEVTHIEHYADRSALPRRDDRDRARRLGRHSGERRRERTVLLFSAHGLPQKFIDEGDPYVSHIEATRLGVLERLQLCRIVSCSPSSRAPGR